MALELLSVREGRTYWWVSSVNSLEAAKQALHLAEIARYHTVRKMAPSFGARAAPVDWHVQFLEYFEQRLGKEKKVLSRLLGKRELTEWIHSLPNGGLSRLMPAGKSEPPARAISLLTRERVKKDKFLGELVSRSVLPQALEIFQFSGLFGISTLNPEEI